MSGDLETIDTPDGTLVFDERTGDWKLHRADTSARISARRALRLLVLAGALVPGVAFATTMGGGYGSSG